MGFPGGSDGKESGCNAGDLGSILQLVRSPEGGHGNPLQYSCLENPHGQRSQASYSHGIAKSQTDTTEQLSTFIQLLYSHAPGALFLWVARWQGLECDGFYGSHCVV